MRVSSSAVFSLRFMLTEAQSHRASGVPAPAAVRLAVTFFNEIAALFPRFSGTTTGALHLKRQRRRMSLARKLE
jgi:hypothetical protein